MRSFVAIELPEDVRAALSSEQVRLRALCTHSDQIRWTSPGTLHLTLKFLGDVSSESLPAVIAALQALGPFQKFEVEAKGFGFFPDARHPRVFWTGLDAPTALPDLARRVESAMERLGFAREDRGFNPHLTLARFRTPRADPALETAIQTMRDTSLGRFEVREFYLFESRLLPAGAEHKKVARFAAGGPS